MLYRLYFKIFNFLYHAPSDKKEKIDQRAVHSHIHIVLMTSIFMWAYTLVALIYMESWVPGLIGVFCSLIYLLTPLLFRWFTSVFWISNLMLLMGLVHQSSFSFFSGGLRSSVLIWFGILPYLGASIAGKKSIFLWATLTASVAGLFLLGHLANFPFPNQLSPNGWFVSQVLVLFGYIFLSSIISYSYLALIEQGQEQLKSKKENIESLFRVLIHDLVNPISLIQGNLAIAQTAKDIKVQKRAFDRIDRANTSLLEITQNVKRMYTENQTQEGLLFCQNTSLSSAVSEVLENFHFRLNQKSLKVACDWGSLKGVKVWVDPTSFVHQVLSNIISNAVKFSHPETQISIRCTIEDNGMKCLMIEDTGVGIPPEVKTKLLEGNFQTTRLGTHGEGGSGLGLYLVKTFVEKYGGKVSIESVSNLTTSGTTIKLFLK